MSSKLARHAYEKLIEEDLDWLMKQPRTLEREHIALILKRSPTNEYDLVEEVERLKGMVKEREVLAEKYCGMLDAVVAEQAPLYPSAQTPEQKVLHGLPGLKPSCSCGTPDNQNFEHGWEGCKPNGIFKQQYRVEFPKRCACGDPHNQDVDHDEHECAWKKRDRGLITLLTKEKKG